MFEWKQTIADAKELLDMGAITQEQFEQIRSEALAQRTESTSPPSTLPKLNEMGTRVQTDGVTPQNLSSDLGNMGTMIVNPNTIPPSSFDNMDAMVGQNQPETIGSYRIVELLGQGGMGSVYKGRHKNEQVAKARGDVAIKMIHPFLAKDEDFKTRFVKEGLFGMSLQHPNIAKVIDVVDEGGTLALLMDYIEGQELAEVIPSEGMDVAEVIEMLEPLASAMDYLHEKGIVHRDMKPANVRIKPDGTPVILDFGIAKDTNEADNGMTQTGTAMGTQAYMAPEQMDAKRVTGTADQYALSMMAYQMLSGQFPWASELSSARITMVKLTGDVAPLDSIFRVSSSVSQVVMKGLSLKPEDRYDSCMAFVQSLKGGAQSLSNSAESTTNSVLKPQKETVAPTPIATTTSENSQKTLSSESNTVPEEISGSQAAKPTGKSPLLIGLFLVGGALLGYFGVMSQTSSDAPPPADANPTSSSSGTSSASQPSAVIQKSKPTVTNSNPEIRNIGQSHCSSEQVIVFNCTTTNGKVVSACASKNASYNQGYMQYHYGMLGNKDIYYPKGYEPANENFTFQTSFGARSENLSLKVTRGSHSYTMRSSLDPRGDGNEGDILVAKSGKTLTTIPCREYPEHLSSETYKRMGVVEEY